MQSKKKLRKQITELMMEKLDQIYEELGLAVTKKSAKKKEKLAKKVAKSLADSKRKMDKKASRVQPKKAQPKKVQSKKAQPTVAVEAEVNQEAQETTLPNGKRPSPNRKNPADKVV